MRSRFQKMIFGYCLWAIAGIGWVAAQNVSVEGTVLDENGEGLAGATVQVEGTGKGMLTSEDGSFRIEGLSAGENVVA
ncbi:MAG: carboxypeptidase regulatory-like domain-containing protein, partial [Bacteroidota bacterium]